MKTKSKTGETTENCPHVCSRSYLFTHFRPQSFGKTSGPKVPHKEAANERGNGKKNGEMKRFLKAKYKEQNSRKSKQEKMFTDS